MTEIRFRPSLMERLARNVGLAIIVVIGLTILWDLVLPWLPRLAVLIGVFVLLRLWWWYRTRW